MMRKLAVTVFVFSLAALGCGSDDGTPAKTDATAPLDGAKLDVNKDVPQGAEVQVPLDSAIDQAQGAETQTVDAQASEAGQTEAGTVKPDTKPAVDTQSVDQGTGSHDGGVTVDSGSAVDGGAALDSASAG